MKSKPESPPQRASPALTQRLRRQDRRVTGPRQAILDALNRLRRPLSSKEVQSELRGEQCNLATVYRALHLLEEMRIVKRCDLGDGVARFQLLGEDDDGHRHHLVCTACRLVVDLPDCCLADMERTVAQRHRFQAVTHRLEFFGVCPDCQPAVRARREPSRGA